MSHQMLLHLLSYLILVGAVFLWLVDVLVEFDVGWAIKIKWSLFWYAVRYAFGIAAIVLALDILF